MEPPTKRADGRQAHSNKRRLAQLGDHVAGWLTVREPPLCLLAQFGPRIRTRSFPPQCTTDPAQMRSQRLRVPPPGDSGRTPDRPDTGHEVPSRAPSLKLLTAMRLAEPDGNAVRQEMLSPCPLARTPADRTHRQLTDPRPLVVTQRHAPRMPPPHVSNLHRSANSFAHLCVNCRHIHRDGSQPVGRLQHGQLALRGPLGVASRTPANGPPDRSRPTSQPCRGRCPASEQIVGTHNRASLPVWPVGSRPLWPHGAPRHPSGATAP